MKGSKKNTNKAELYIPLNGNIKLKRQIINISSHKGITYSQFLRSEIIKLVEIYPSNIKDAPMEE